MTCQCPASANHLSPKRVTPSQMLARVRAPRAPAHRYYCGALAAGAYKRNIETAKRLRPDEDSEALLAIAENDASLGRMTDAIPLSKIDPTKVVLTPRFAVRQGVKADGTAKALPRQLPALRNALPPAREVRAVDDCTASCLNEGTRAHEKMRHDNTDHLFELAAIFHNEAACASCGARVVVACHARQGGILPHLWKADVDSAFRRIPLRPEDKDLAWVAFPHQATLYAAAHNACPFGAGARRARPAGSGLRRRAA